MARNHRHRVARAAGSAALAAALLLLAACGSSHAGPNGAATRGRRAKAAAASGAVPASSAGASPAHVPPRVRAARHALRRLVHSRRRGSISVAALDRANGHEIALGPKTGMLPASVAKVELLETLLLRAQRSGHPLTTGERETAEAMIEHSDNDAANTIYYDDGGGPGLVAALKPLGLSHRYTKPSYDDYWGLAPTSASQQIFLLHDLVATSSVLGRGRRRFALHLMRNVETDQRWGVPVVADPHTTYAVKNGWLGVDEDGGLWAVNSDGIVTLHGHTVLISVMTQHNSDFASGVQLVERLARAVAALVVAER